MGELVSNEPVDSDRAEGQRRTCVIAAQSPRWHVPSWPVGLEWGTVPGPWHAAPTEARTS